MFCLFTNVIVEKKEKTSGKKIEKERIDRRNEFKIKEERGNEDYTCVVVSMALFRLRNDST